MNDETDTSDCSTPELTLPDVVVIEWLIPPNNKNFIAVTVGRFYKCVRLGRSTTFGFTDDNGREQRVLQNTLLRNLASLYDYRKHLSGRTHVPAKTLFYRCKSPHDPRFVPEQVYAFTENLGGSRGYLFTYPRDSLCEYQKEIVTLPYAVLKEELDRPILWELVAVDEFSSSAPTAKEPSDKPSPRSREDFIDQALMLHRDGTPEPKPVPEPEPAKTCVNYDVVYGFPNLLGTRNAFRDN